MSKSGWRLSVLIIGVASAVLVGFADFVLITTDDTDPTVRPVRADAAGEATPTETAHSYVAALNERDRARLMELSIADTVKAKQRISALLERDGGQQIRVIQVHVHPGVASYHATIEIRGSTRSEQYHQTLELNKREQQ